ncbi:protein neprosin-like [Aegilops tauschii subsp. strangulata]|uniref:protein neprosin-like n=1 Tax=Aegilops tauschii subsp. strangulata TaxID=200361 RepID=UPI003CC8BE21
MKRHPLIIVMLFLSFLFFSCGQGRSSTLSESDFELERELKMLNTPYVKSFKDNYGVVFDCVDIYKQPAFDHPLLKNHVLQMPPNSSSGTGLPTTGESCPYGTVPIRRTLKEDLVRGRALRPVYKPTATDTNGIDVQHFALVLLDSEKGKTFQSASASIEVYYFPMPSDAASTAQMLVVDDRSSNVTVVQAGWHIDPGREGDGQSRLTVYWTADDYKQTGCPNMQCPGFVLVNQYVAPGTAFPAGSSIALTIFRHEIDGDVHALGVLVESGTARSSLVAAEYSSAVPAR